MRETDYPAAEAIAYQLGHRPGGKGWFSPEACKHTIPRDIRVQKGFVAETDGRVVGFITYAVHGNTPCIGWIGVEPGEHRRGAGRALVTKVEEALALIGAKELTVETPSRESGMGTEYEKTYKFYEGMGFKIVRIKKRDDSDNHCDCDMAILMKVLA